MRRLNTSKLSTSLDGKITLAASEGVVPAVYMDSVGVATYGIGVTHWAIGKPEMDSLPDAMPSDLNAAIVKVFRLFSLVLQTYEDAVRRSVTVPLHQHEFDALVHFTYNVGEGNLAKSKMLRNLNAGNYDAAWETGFHGWMRPTSLRSRRDLESDLAKNGDYAEGKGIPVYKTNGKRKLAGRLIVMRRSEVVSLLQGGQASPAPVYPRPQIPQEVKDLIEETSSEDSKTDLYNMVVQFVTGGGLLAALPNIKGIVSEVDPIVLAAIVIGVSAAFCVATYTRRSRKRKGAKAIQAEYAIKAMGGTI